MVSSFHRTYDVELKVAVDACQTLVICTCKQSKGNLYPKNRYLYPSWFNSILVHLPFKPFPRRIFWARMPASSRT